MKHVTDLWLDMNDFVIHSSGLNSVLITYFSLCRFLKYFLPYIVEISLKLLLSQSFSCRGRNMMNEDRCE